MPREEIKKKYIPGYIIVKLKSTTEKEKILKVVRQKKKDHCPSSNSYIDDQLLKYLKT